METIYDRAALQQYMDDVDSINKSLKQRQDESIQLYNSCKERYTRLASELEQEKRTAYNRVEAAESLCRAANAECEKALRALENAENENERSTAHNHLQQARQRQASAYNEFAKANAVYAQVQANIQRLTDIWNQHSPAATIYANTTEERYSSFVQLVSHGNSALGEYMAMMDKAHSALYDGASETATGSSSSQSSNTDVDSAASNGAAESQSESQTSDNASHTTESAPGWPANNSMSAVHIEENKGKVVSMTIGGVEKSFSCNKEGVAQAYRQALASGDGDMVARTRAMFEIETLRESLELDSGDSSYVQLGGYHRDVKKQDPQGYESHHIPARSVQDTNAEWLPAISIAKDDHKLTSSFSGKQRRVYQSVFSKDMPSVNYKENVTQSLEKGSPGYIDVVKNELLDLRASTGHRYDRGVSAYLDAVVDMLSSKGFPGAKR